MPNESESDEDFDALMNDQRKNPDLQIYSYKLSGASFDISEVTGIIFGGLSSRFWMFRK